MLETTAVCGDLHLRCQLPARFFKFQKGPCVRNSTGPLGGEIVAGVFALSTNRCGEEPGRGMEKENRFAGYLQEIYEKIVAPNMHQFVQDERFELAGREFGEERRRQKEHGLPVADYCRNIGERGCAELYGALNSKFAGPLFGFQAE